MCVCVCVRVCVRARIDIFFLVASYVFYSCVVEHHTHTHGLANMPLQRLMEDEAVVDVARSSGMTPGQVLLACLLRRGIVVIPKVRTYARTRYAARRAGCD